MLNIPRMILDTVTAERFITSMGIGRCNMRIDIQQADTIKTLSAPVHAAAIQDPCAESVADFKAVLLTVLHDNGSVSMLKTELGDHTIFPVEYVSGTAPVGADELAVSVLNAQELGVETGSTIRLLLGGTVKAFRICGIYGDITNGGKTAKAVFPYDGENIMWYVICVRFIPGTDTAAAIARYATRFPAAKISDITEYLQQTLGGIIRSLHTASLAAAIAALAVAALVTMLFVRLITAQNRYAAAIMLGCGFSVSDLIAQYLIRISGVLLTALILGTVLAYTAGQALAGAALNMLGAPSFRFSSNPLFVFCISPVLISATVYAAARVVAIRTAPVCIAETIRE
jgi:putative ABC transport system permease protein